MGFHTNEFFPGVYHIEDALGVCMTLLCGSREAILVDAGFGLEDLAAYAASLTDKPIRLVLSHGHYDHILGAGYFPEAALFPADLPLAHEHEFEFWRRRVLDAAAEREIPADERAVLGAPEPVWTELEEGTVDLGSLTVQVIRCPGHTPGSAVFYIPERELLLTGDDWNPCTWLFFEEALSVWDYRRNMEKLLALPFRHVLCPHRNELYDRAMLENFVLGLTEETLRAAKEVDTGAWLGIRTLEAAPASGQILVFDADKQGLGL